MAKFDLVKLETPGWTAQQIADHALASGQSVTALNGSVWAFRVHRKEPPPKLAPTADTLDTHTSGLSRAIGWIGDDDVLLLPDLAWEAVEGFFGKDRWPYRQNQLQKQLAEESILKRDEDGQDAEHRLTCRRTLGGKMHRVLVISKKHFEEALPNQDHAREQVLRRIKDDEDRNGDAAQDVGGLN